MLAIIIDVSRKRGPGIRHLDEWQRARLRLNSEWGANLKIEHLAASMGIGVDHFIRRDKQRFGMSPKIYQTHARLREAVRLLRSTEKSTKMIAYEMGFADPKSFFRLFKKHLGVVPSDLRLDGKSRQKIKSARVKSLFPINRHVLPPDAAPNFEAQWRLRSKTRKV
jgi:AraC-like DNA-binding protein